MEHETAFPGSFSLAPVLSYLFGPVQLLRPKPFVSHRNILSPTDYVVHLLWSAGYY